MTATTCHTAHHHTHPPGAIFIFTVGSISRVPVVGRGCSIGDLERKSSSKIKVDGVGQVKQILGWFR